MDGLAVAAAAGLDSWHRKFYENRSTVVLKLTGVGSPSRLNRFSRIKFPVYVRVRTRTTRIQDAILASIDPTRRARDGN